MLLERVGETEKLWRELSSKLCKILWYYELNFETVSQFSKNLGFHLESKQIDDYLIWLSSAENKMREGVNKGYVLPKSLIKKVIPQLRTILNSNLDQNLFYSPARQFPQNFNDTQRLEFKEKYKTMVLAGSFNNKW